MTVQVFLGAGFASATVMAGVAAIVPPRRHLDTRVRPYAALSRSRLGTGYADVSVVVLTRTDDRSPFVRVVGPVVQRVADVFGQLVDTSDRPAMANRLRQAGFVDTSPEQYRLRQLAGACGGLTLGVALGMLLFGTPGWTLLLAALFGFPGSTLQRNRVQKAIDVRRAAMRSEASTVAQLLAVHIRSGHGPVDAVRGVCSLGRGPVIEELQEALGWIGAGISPERAYDKLADATAEPAAGRLYRLLSSSARSGGDISRPLLSIADELRSERRDELARMAVKRRTAMLAPLLLMIAPVMVIFVGAALPALVLGTGS